MKWTNVATDLLSLRVPCPVIIDLFVKSLILPESESFIICVRNKDSYFLDALLMHIPHIPLDQFSPNAMITEFFPYGKVMKIPSSTILTAFLHRCEVVWIITRIDLSFTQ